jgi:hypothetical protein
MVSEGMGTEIELTEEALKDILTGECCGKSQMPWCVQFEDCDDCYADIVNRISGLSEVYVVTRVPYGNHNTEQSATLIGIYRSLEKAKETVECRVMELRPTVLSEDGNMMRYGYAMGDVVTSSVQLPQYVIRRYLL